MPKVLGIMQCGGYIVYDSIAAYEESGDCGLFSDIVVGTHFEVFDSYADLSDCEDAADDPRGPADDYGYREDRDGDDNDHGIRIGYVSKLHRFHKQ